MSINSETLSKITAWAKSTNNYDRGHSWNYCYKHFQDFYIKSPKNSDDIDLAALNLWAYLASWGMLRGSAFLAQECNYKVLICVVELLIDDKYANLWQADCYNLPNFISDAWSLIKEIIQKLTPYCSRGNFQTDTLTTKIILGTCCCLPAFDIYFKAGMKKNGLQQSLSTRSIAQIVSFINEPINSDLYLIKEFPIMKTIDSYFYCEGGGK